MSSADHPSFSLLTSIRYDSEYVEAENPMFSPASTFASHMWLSQFHVDRLRHAAQAHRWTKAAEFSVEDFIKAGQSALDSFCKTVSDSDGPYACKLRILLDESGNFKSTAARIPRRPFSELLAAAAFDPTSGSKPEDFGPILEIAVDSAPTPASIFTATKTEHRPMYDAARARAGVPPVGVAPSGPAPSDVLLFNEDKKLTETSIRNISFFRDGAWVTPSADTGCLTGVVRRDLLQQGLIHESHALTIDDVRDQEIVMLTNGIEGCRLGRIVKST